MNQVPQEFIEKLAIAHGVSNSALQALLPALHGEPAENIAKQLNIQMVAYRKRMGEVYKRFGIEGKKQGKLIQLKQFLLAEYTSQQHHRGSALQVDSEPLSDHPIDVAGMQERHRELANLEEWIVRDKIRLLTLFGQGGIGKTSLAARIYEQLKGQFEQVAWRSLQTDSTLSELLNSLLKKLKPSQDAETEGPEDIDAQIRRLLDYLSRERCLIILDDAQEILEKDALVGKYRQGYEKFGELLKKVGETLHRSCLIITSREKPKEIAPLEGDTLPTRAFQVLGLNVNDSRSLLKTKGLDVSDDDLNRLIKIYGGNPLALKVAAAAIDELFDSKVDSFLEQEVSVFGDIQSLLEQQFERLTPLEEDIMYWLAINGEPISSNELEKDIVFFDSKTDLLEALNSLKWRSLIEKLAADQKSPASKSAKFTQHPVVAEYVIQQLIKHSYEEIIDRTNFRFLNRYALIKATSKDAFREAQEKRILKPICRKLINKFSDISSDIKEQLKAILTQYKTSRSTGYLVGNLLNICQELHFDLAEISPDKDFSGLTVWQANLVKTNLQDISFARADLRGSVFADHIGSLVSVTFVADGRFFATGSNNGDIRIWRIADSKQLQMYFGHSRRGVRSLDCTAANAGGTALLVSGGDDCTVQLWEIQLSHLQRDDKFDYCASDLDRPLITFKEHTQGVRAVTISPDGSRVLSGSQDKTARLWDVTSATCLEVFPHPDAVLSVALHPHDSQRIACASGNAVYLWQQGRSTPECLLGHSRDVLSVRFNSTGQYLASSSEDQTICIWDLATGQILHQLRGHAQTIYSVRFSPEDPFKLASGSADKTIRIWTFTEQDFQCIHTLNEHRSQVWSLTFSPDGTRILSGSDDQTARLWQVDNGKLLNTLQGSTRGVYAVAFSPDGKYLATGDDQDLRLWDIATPKLLSSPRGYQGRIRSVMFKPSNLASLDSEIAEPSGEYVLASGAADATVRQWKLNEAQGWQCLETYDYHKNWVSAIAYSPDGQQMASGSEDYTVWYHRLQPDKAPQQLGQHTGPVWSVAFSPDNQLLASGSTDQTIQVWDTTHLKLVQELVPDIEAERKSVLCIAFAPVLTLPTTGSPDQVLASGTTDQTIWLWNVSTGKKIGVLQGHSGAVFALAFSPDGTILASAGADGAVKLWDVHLMECLDTKHLHQAPIRAIAFNPDGTLLATGSEDETIVIWNRSTDVITRIESTDRLYQGMDITDAIGLSDAQRASLQALGAISTEFPGNCTYPA